MADFCAVDLLDEPGRRARPPGRRRRPRRRGRGALRELGRCAATPPGRPRHRAGARRRRRPAAARAARARPAAIPGGPAAAAVYERLRPRSAMVVPVRARGRVLGALTLAHPASLRPPLRPARPAPGRRPRGARRAGRRQRPALRGRARRGGDAAAQPAAGGAARCAGLQVAARYLVGRGRQPGRRRLVRRAHAARRRGRRGGRRRRRARPAGGGRDGPAARGACAPTPGTAARPGRCWTAATSWSRAWRWRRWPRPSTPGWSAGPDGDRHAALRQRRAPAAAAARPGRHAAAARREPLPDDRGGTDFAGRGPGGPRHERALSPGSVLVLYTDGLTDIAGEDADERTALLERTVAAMPPRVEPSRRRPGPGGVLPDPFRDDVALLAVRLNP